MILIIRNLFFLLLITLNKNNQKGPWLYWLLLFEIHLVWARKIGSVSYQIFFAALWFGVVLQAFSFLFNGNYFPKLAFPQSLMLLGISLFVLGYRSIIQPEPFGERWRKRQWPILFIFAFFCLIHYFLSAAS